MNSNSDPLSVDDDRRDYFRIDDVVKISYHRVPTEELTERLERLEEEFSSNFTVMSSFSAIGQQMALQLHRIESNSPDVAACIKALDQKLNILGQAFMAQEDGLIEQPAQAVNISAGGIALNGVEEIKIGTTLEIKLLLLPSLTGVLIYGEVVACDANEESDSDDYPYQLRIDFSHMRESDRDILIRHILRRQGEWLRKRREENEDNEDKDE